MSFEPGIDFNYPETIDVDLKPSVSEEEVAMNVYAPILLLKAMEDEPSVKAKIDELGIHNELDMAASDALEKFSEFMNEEEEDEMGDQIINDVYMYKFDDSNHACRHVIMINVNGEFYYSRYCDIHACQRDQKMIAMVTRLLGHNICIINDKPEGFEDEYDEMQRFEDLF